MPEQSARDYGTYIALDMSDFTDVLTLVRATSDLVDGYKVHASAEAALAENAKELRNAGAQKLWWDRKAHDTPDTVASIARTAVRCGFQRLTVHASGGIEMMMAAVKYGPKDIIAITDLTSLQEAEIGILSGKPVDASVLLKVREAQLAGVRYIVCSGKEVSLLNARRAFSKATGQNLELHGMKFIVPGSRTLTDDMGSQRRSLTAMETLDAGADELVLGSEIWKAPEPRTALLKLQQMIAESKMSSGEKSSKA